MKQIFTLLAFMLIMVVSNAQKHDNFSPIKCGHSHSQTTNELKVSDDLLKYDVKFYYLDIEATNNNSSLKGFTKILASTLTEELSTFVIELHDGIQVDSVFINGLKKDFTHTDDEISVPLTNTISANTNFTAQVYYNRPSTLNTDGIYTSYVSDWQKKVSYTLSEPYYAKNWFACKQDLNDKADSVWVFITIDANLKAGSNGTLTKITELENGKNRYEWKSNYPIAYYLISIAVADYTEYNIYSKPESLNGDSILIQNYLYNNYSGLQSQKDGMDATSDLISLFSNTYSLYPFWQEKYGHCYAPLGGAMEHQTMTTTGSHVFYIIAHELGHQWFGDNVTCASWQDIWINEGFASYSEYLAYENLYSSDRAHQHLMEAQYYARQSPTGSIYIPFEDLNNENILFSWSITYRKGLCLVHMIRTEINNDEIFFDMLKGFQNTYKNKAATGADFRDYLNENSGIDFTNFFNEWYYGEGYPTYNCKWNQSNGTININISQETTAASTPLFTNTIDFKLNYAGGDTTIRLKPTYNNEGFSFLFDKEISSIEIDPESNILASGNTIEVGISEKQANKIEIFPNPILNQLHINSYTTLNKIEIFNSVGIKCFELKPNSNAISIETFDWENGIYLIKTYTNIGANTLKIVKN